MPAPRTLVIFDNDGVLVDSERSANTILARLLTDLGVPTTFDESVERYLGSSIGRVRSMAEAELGAALPDDFERRYHDELFADWDRSLTAVAGVEAVLDGLTSPWCVASSGSHARIEAALTRAGLWARAAGRIFSADDVARGKPAPDLFRHAAARMGAAPADCIVVEDSPLGVEAARAAGMRVIGFTAVTPAHRLAAADVLAATMAEVGAALA